MNFYSNFTQKIMEISLKFNHKFCKLLGKLNSKIIKYNLVVSGSFVISTILNEIYYNSDIDIYVPYKFIQNLDGSIDHPFDKWIVEFLGGVLFLSGSSRDKNLFTYKYICPDKTINIINYVSNTKEEMYSYITESSDIDICTCTYDGNVTRFIPSIFEKKARSINQHLIENTNFNQEYQPYSPMQHVRAFIIKRKARIIKYTERGFQIETLLIITEDDRCRNYSFNSNQCYNVSQIISNIINIAYHVKFNEECSNQLKVDYENYNYKKLKWSKVWINSLK